MHNVNYFVMVGIDKISMRFLLKLIVPDIPGITTTANQFLFHLNSVPVNTTTLAANLD